MATTLSAERWKALQEDGMEASRGAVLTLRIALITLASLALILLGLCEIALAWPVAWWLYLSVAVMFAVALIRAVPPRSQPGRLGGLAVLLALIASLYLVDWTTRKPFLRDLARVHVGMTEAEVRRIMGRYREGTGWPAVPGGAVNAPGTLDIVGSDSRYATEASSAGQLAIRESLVFRHSDDGAFNSDWGIISFSDGRVVHVEFSPD